MNRFRTSDFVRVRDLWRRVFVRAVFCSNAWRVGTLCTSCAIMVSAACDGQFLMVCLRFVLCEEIQNVVYADSSSAMNWGYSKGLWQGSWPADKDVEE